MTDSQLALQSSFQHINQRIRISQRTRKGEVAIKLTMLKAQLGDKYKRNSMASYVDELIEREKSHKMYPIARGQISR